MSVDTSYFSPISGKAKHGGKFLLLNQICEVWSAACRTDESPDPLYVTLPASRLKCQQRFHLRSIRCGFGT